LQRQLEGGSVEILGDGEQTRSFLYINEWVEGVRRLTESSCTGPVNIGLREMISINGLAEMVMRIADKRLHMHRIRGPLGVRGRNSDNRLIAGKQGWAFSRRLIQGIRVAYHWVEKQVLIQRDPQSQPVTASS
jgi:nucleoside-diphosphate-sugar epimerase